jgi:hypothetical protein
MKKCVLIVVTAVVCCSVRAEVLTALQKKAKSEIFSALRNYGTNISDRGENVLTFQNSGTTYHVSINSLNSQTLYLILGVGFNLGDGYNSEKANRAAFQAALNKPVCSYADSEELCFSCEMYSKDAKNFIAVLPEMLQALKSSADSFQKEYDNANDTYASSNNSYVPDSKEYVFPMITSTASDKKLYITKVSIENGYTVLDMISYNGAEYSYCSISRNSCLYANGKKYTLNRAEGIAYAPQYTFYPNYKSGKDVSLSFRLYFPALPSGTTSFNFSEGDSGGWQIYGIELKHGVWLSVSGETIETAYHKWSCKSVEVQNDQTIITKQVTPTSNDTYVNSSQEEYIEDADTGRKYYLQNTSIGFESAPTIVHDISTITFYEVYPALPSNVKRINISSGSQYYVKNLKIR